MLSINSDIGAGHGQLANKELGIPVLLLEKDDFDPRLHNHEQYKRRLEVFKTMLNTGREHKRSVM